MVCVDMKRLLCWRLVILRIALAQVLWNVLKASSSAFVSTQHSDPYSNIEIISERYSATLAFCEIFGFLNTGLFSAPKALLAAEIRDFTSALSVASEDAIEPR